MSDDATKDLGIAVRLALGKRMKEALLLGDGAEAAKWAARLQEAEDLMAADPSGKAPHADAPRKGVQVPAESKTADGEWIN
jgi:hypothetical protein